MSYWLIKSEPSEYSYDDLMRDKKTVWDGITNNQALMYLREMNKGDRALYYHTGGEKTIVGVVKLIRGPYPDPKLEDQKRVVVDVAPVAKFPEPVSLAAIKSDEAFADFHLVRNSRLSVMPVPVALWKKLCTMGGVKAG